MTGVPPASRRPLAGAATSPLLVDVADLRVSFPKGKRLTEVVHGVSLRIAAGECVALVGESGSGKSVTARSLIGLAGPGATVTAGGFRINGEDASGYGERQWRALRGGFAGLVAQDAMVSLDPLRTIGAEIAEVLRIHGVVPRNQVRTRTIELLDEAGVPDPAVRAAQYAHQLSGGLRQRALIAAAVAAQPRLIIADEPTTALDVTIQAQVLGLLASRVSANASLLLVSHDLAVVAGIADRVLVMRAGTVVEEGPASEVLASPRHAYTQALLSAIPSSRSRGRSLSGAPIAPRTADGPADTDPVLAARSLRKSFTRKTPAGGRDRFTAVDDVSFHIGRGEIVGIVGESGSGKSTCANMALALTKPDTGEVLLHARPWSGLPERARRRLRPRVQLVSQDPLSSFDPRHTVGQLISESLLALGGPASRRRERAAEVLRQVGLGGEFLERYPRHLSGGERQRVAIARAIAPEPDLIVCDEPVSALDVSVQAQVLDLLADLRNRSGLSLLFISHDLGVVHHLADRVIVLSEGRIVEQGDADEVFLRPQHPYTKQLIASLPAIEAPAAALQESPHSANTERNPQ